MKIKKNRKSGKIDIQISQEEIDAQIAHDQRVFEEFLADTKRSDPALWEVLEAERKAEGK